MLVCGSLHLFLATQRFYTATTSLAHCFSMGFFPLVGKAIFALMNVFQYTTLCRWLTVPGTLRRFWTRTRQAVIRHCMKTIPHAHRQRRGSPTTTVTSGCANRRPTTVGIGDLASLPAVFYAPCFLCRTLPAHQSWRTSRLLCLLQWTVVSIFWLPRLPRVV